VTYLDAWRSGTFPKKTASKRVRYQSQTRTVERLSARHQTVLATFPRFRKPLYSCTEGFATLPHVQVRMSLHVTQIYQAFHRVSSANNKCWGEKARVRGYWPATFCNSGLHYTEARLVSQAKTFLINSCWQPSCYLLSATQVTLNELDASESITWPYFK